MDNLKGLELLHSLTRDQLTSKEDSLVLVFHCMLINAGKKCVGVGEEWPETSSLRGSELLPANWNLRHDVYALRYVSDSPSGRYLLKVSKAENIIIVNVVDVNAERAAGMPVSIAKHVTEDIKEFSNAYTNLDDLSKSFHKEVLSDFTGPKKESNSDSKPKYSGEANGIPIKDTMKDPSLNPRIPEELRQVERGYDCGFPPVGRGDLDPFYGGVGGGMLVDPNSFRHPPMSGMPRGSFDPFGLPRGSVPPGARFDQFGPPGSGGGTFRPDFDHLPPPGYNDMFM